MHNPRLKPSEFRQDITFLSIMRSQDIWWNPLHSIYFNICRFSARFCIGDPDKKKIIKKISTIIDRMAITYGNITKQFTEFSNIQITRSTFTRHSYKH